MQTPAVHNVGRSSRCSCRGIQHFGQHLDQLSPRWNSNAVLLQTGLKDFVVGNMTTFIPRCGGEGEGGGDWVAWQDDAADKEHVKVRGVS